jgi:hypothetical protein
MLEFDVFHFVRHSDTLQKLQREIEGREDVPLNPQERQQCAAVMNEIKEFLAGFEIDTGQCFERIEYKIHYPEKAKPKLSSSILELRNRINDEIKERLFMFVPAKDAEYYNHFALFGQNVASKFPKANEEITDAGNCYATGNYTACVFHLMRAVEHGARALVKRLSIKTGGGKDELPFPVELCDWGVIYTRLNAAVNKLPSRTSVKASDRRAFYSHAAAQFGNFKDAWRNRISHTRIDYRDRPHLVSDVIDNTRQFMQHLANGGLNEPKTRSK